MPHTLVTEIYGIAFNSIYELVSIQKVLRMAQPDISLAHPWPPLPPQIEMLELPMLLGNQKPIK